MEKEMGILQSVGHILKKKIFNRGKNDFCHGCVGDLSNTVEKDFESEEYVRNYQSTTRWQTI